MLPLPSHPIVDKYIDIFRERKEISRGSQNSEIKTTIFDTIISNFDENSIQGILKLLVKNDWKFISSS